VPSAPCGASLQAKRQFVTSLHTVTPRPHIFISAVSRELRSARQLVANTLTFLGYQPVWQDIFGTETGDLRSMLREKIDQCKGIVQLVGQSYGAEPPAADEEFGRVSYTQYEALYARKRGKKVWYLFIDETFPIDAHQPEPEELRQLQLEYRRRVQSDTHVFHSLTTTEGLEASVLKLRDDLTRLRRSARQWALGITALLFVIVGLVIWQLRGQAQMKTEMKAEIAKLRQGIMQYARTDAEVRGSRTENNPAAVQEQIYAELGKQLGVEPKVLREKLPRLADQLKRSPKAGAYERANASYVAKDYAEAERLALEAAAESQRTKPENSKNIVAALELAGLSAHRAIQYDRAMQHFREAEKLTDRNRNLTEWVRLQDDIADLLVAQGRYSNAETVFRSVIEARTLALGPEHPDTLDSRHRLIYALSRQSKYAEAEAEAREVLRLREKVLGPDHPDTAVSRYNLAEPLAEQGKYPEAETLYRDVIRLEEKVLGPDDPRTLAARVGLATVLSSEGKNAEAEPLYREIITLDQKVYGAEHPNTLNDRQNLATALQADGKYAEAEEQYRDVIKIDTKLIGPEHPDTLICRNNFAEMLDDEGKFAEAERECRQIIDTETRVLGPENLVTLNSRGNLAIALIGQGKFAEALSEYADVLKLMERALGLEHPDTLNYATKIAMALSNQNRLGEATQIARQMEEHANKTLRPDNEYTRRYSKLAQDLEAKR
jgi:tetratricopeptide (TPR) repeat protein